MRLLLEAPQVAMIDCRDCCKNIYNLDTGKRDEYDAGGVMLPIARPVPPPCASCPKGEVDLAGEMRLSQRNIKSYRMWEEIKACGNVTTLPRHLAECSIFAANMTTISRVYKSAEIAIKSKLRESHD